MVFGDGCTECCGFEIIDSSIAAVFNMDMLLLFIITVKIFDPFSHLDREGACVGLAKI